MIDYLQYFYFVCANLLWCDLFDTNMARNNISLASSLTKFSGEDNENLEFFVKNFEQISEIEKFDAQKKALILKLNLAGKALKLISDSNLSADNEYEQIIKILRTKFHNKLNYAQIQGKFNSLVQKPNQDIKNLTEEVEKITDLYLDLNKDSQEETLKLAAKMKAQKLLDAMRPDLRLEVMKRGAIEFSEISKIACDIENALSIPNNHINNINKSSDIDLLLKSQLESNQKIQELTDKVNELTRINPVNNVIASNNNRNTKYTCHICFKGHITTDCWYYPNNTTNKRYQPYNNNNNDRNNRRGNFSRNFRGRSNFRRFNNRRNNHLN